MDAADEYPCHLGQYGYSVNLLGPSECHEFFIMGDLFESYLVVLFSAHFFYP